MCFYMVGPQGFEPWTGRLKVCCDNHFTMIPYLSWIVFQVPIQTDMGSELTLWFSWSLHIVPLLFEFWLYNNLRMLSTVFFWCPTTESNCHHRITKPVYCHCTSRSKIGSSGWDRTTDTLINSQVQLPLCYTSRTAVGYSMEFESMLTESQSVVLTADTNYTIEKHTLFLAFGKHACCFG